MAENAHGTTSRVWKAAFLEDSLAEIEIDNGVERRRQDCNNARERERQEHGKPERGGGSLWGKRRATSHELLAQREGDHIRVNVANAFTIVREDKRAGGRGGGETTSDIP